MPLGPPSPKWWEHWGLLRELRRERFDVAYNFSGADRSVLVTAFLGARNSVVHKEGGIISGSDGSFVTGFRARNLRDQCTKRGGRCWQRADLIWGRRGLN